MRISFLFREQVSLNEYLSSAPRLRYKRGTNSPKLTVKAYVVKKREREILVALTNSHVSSEVYPSLPRFDGMALNNVHYAVEVRELCPPKRRALNRRWKFERTASQACSTDWLILPPTRQPGLRKPQRFTAQKFGAKSARSRSLSEAVMCRLIVRPPVVSALILSFRDFLSHGY
jgi:hypothetical protein